MNPIKLIQKIWQTIFVATWRKVEQEKEATPAYGFHREVVGVFIVTAICLVVAEYVSSFRAMMRLIENLFGKATAQQLWDAYHHHINPKWVSVMYWVTINIISYLIIPLVYIKWGLKKKFSEFGWTPRATRQDLLLYASCFAVMLPLVMLVATSQMFLLKYPFYQPRAHANWLYYFLLWELMYLIQFIAVEFFFRGFLLHGIKKQLGAYSIWIAMIPYCMIHFKKPMPETFGAIIAGLVLATFSLKNNSVWLGVLLHYSVAITMDLLALWHKGFL
ncbi:hypothetical protein BKI52_28470 [marine bacterium AO1-C]|nr:hypothetical protein BKI52_28470 [marine bacterium AO1-C]